MKNKQLSWARIAFIASVCSAAAATAARTILTFTLLDANYGVYRHGSILPNIFHIILAAVCIALALMGIFKAPNLSKEHSVPLNTLTAFASFASALLIAARAAEILWFGAASLTLGKIEITEAVFAIISALYFIALPIKGGKRSVGLAFASFGPIGWCTVSLIGLYFDKTVLMTSPNKVLGLVSLLSAMLYFLCETRLMTENLSHRYFLAAASAAPVLLITSALPNVVCYGLLSIGSWDDLIRYAAETVLGLFILARLYAYSRSVQSDSAEIDNPQTEIN